MLAIKLCLAEIIPPFGDDLNAAGFQNRRNVAQGALGNAGIVIAHITAACRCDPDFGGVAGRCALRNVDVDRFEGIPLVGPEINPVRADLKDLRHCQSPLPGQSGG